MREFLSKFAPQIEDYLLFREAMGRSEDHAKQLRFFDRYCCSNFPETNCLNREVVRGWISDEIANGRRGLENKASAIRVFAKYLGNGAYILPMNTIPRKLGYTPYILTDDEMAAFFSTVETFDNRQDPFLRETVSVLWRLLYTCGLRPREGRLIKCSDICFRTGEILVSKAKRSKERIVVMSNEMLELCRLYDVRRSAVASDCEYFFVSGNGTALKADQLNRWVKCCWAQANPGVPPHLLPNLRQYDLRHPYVNPTLKNNFELSKRKLSCHKEKVEYRCFYSCRPLGGYFYSLFTKRRSLSTSRQSPIVYWDTPQPCQAGHPLA